MKKLKSLDNIKDISIRTIGLAMMSFPIGMGIGAVATRNWLLGGLIAFGTSMVGVIVYLGVVLAWTGKMTALDIEGAYRTAANKAAENNDDIKDAISKKDTK